MLGVVTSYPILVIGGLLLGEAAGQRWGHRPLFVGAGLLAGIAACVLETWAALKLWRRQRH
jgi:hypothetical protein